MHLSDLFALLSVQVWWIFVCARYLGYLVNVGSISLSLDKIKTARVN